MGSNLFTPLSSLRHVDLNANICIDQSFPTQFTKMWLQWQLYVYEKCGYESAVVEITTDQDESTLVLCDCFKKVFGATFKK